MAKAYKCDNCGELYEKDGCRLISGYTKEVLDICPNCLYDIKRAMKDRCNNPTLAKALEFTQNEDGEYE